MQLLLKTVWVDRKFNIFKPYCHPEYVSLRFALVFQLYHKCDKVFFYMFLFFFHNELFRFFSVPEDNISLYSITSQAHLPTMWWQSKLSTNLKNKPVISQLDGVIKVFRDEQVHFRIFFQLWLRWLQCLLFWINCK